MAHIADPINVLFTSAGRRIELLRAFQRAYQALNLDGDIVAVDIDPLAPALQCADRQYIVPRVDAPDYIPTLKEVCERENISLVFPLIDPDIPLLARHLKTIEETGAQVVIVPPEAAAITGDKDATAALLHELDLPTPRSWLPEELPAEPEFPLFIKPRDGSAAQDTYKVHSRRELDFFVDYVSDPIVQEFLPGPEITNDVICDFNSDVLAVVSRRRIEVRWGEVAKGVTIHDPVIVDACTKIAQALSAVGPITVQCIRKNGVPYFTEINARFGGGVPLGIAAGVDSPRWLLARAAGIPVDIPPIGSYETDLYLTRFDDAYFLTENDREHVARNHIRHGRHALSRA